MFSKFAVVCLAALAVVAQAGHHKRHTHIHQNGTYTHNPFLGHDHKPSGHPGEAGFSSGVAPYPTGSGAASPLTTGAPRLLTTGPVPTYTTTVIVTKLTTYCPGPTTLTQNGKEYTVTKVRSSRLHYFLFILTFKGNNSHHFRVSVHVHLHNYWLSYPNSNWRYCIDLCCWHGFFDQYRSHHHP